MSRNDSSTKLAKSSSQERVSKMASAATKAKPVKRAPSLSQEKSTIKLEIDDIISKRSRPLVKRESPKVDDKTQPVKQRSKRGEVKQSKTSAKKNIKSKNGDAQSDA